MPFATSISRSESSLLIVDQCEQAFAADDPAEIREFFDALSQMAFRGMLVVAIRADRLGDLADHEGYAQIIQSHMLMLTALSPDGLRTVIEKPAEQAGLILEPGLVEILVRDADGRTLPLLSHALRQVWSRREGRVLTVDGYRASGEIDGAVAKTAEEVFAALSPDGERMLRDILLRLVEASADGAVIARRVERTRIAIDDAHAQIVDRLVDARLLTTDEESVQVSHEALAREWPRLKDWLADDVEGQRIMRHLSATAAAWDAMGRPDSELYRGGRLTTAQHWRDAVDPALTAVEREFLDASAAHETAGLAAAQDQLRKERRMVRRLSWVSAGAATLAIATVTAGLIAGFQANLAGERATVAEARRVAALAIEEPDFDRALLLALEAIGLWDDSETRVNLVRVFSRAPRLTSIIRIQEDGVTPVSMSLAEDGTRASVIDSDHDVRLFDLDDRSQLAEYAPFSRLVVTSAIDPVTGAVAVSETSDPCNEARCDFRRTATLDLARRRTLGRDELRGDGQAGGRPGVLGGRFPARSARPASTIRLARERRPLASRCGRPDPSDAPGSGCQRFRSGHPIAARRGVRCGEVLAGRLATLRQRVRPDHRVRHGNGRGAASDRRQRDSRGQSGWQSDRGPRWPVRGAHRRPLRGRSTHHRPALVLALGAPTSAPTAVSSPSPPATASWWRAPARATSPRRSATMTER